MLDIKTVISHINETGLALAKYGDAGYGEMTAYDKYRAPYYRKELIIKSAAVLTQTVRELSVEAVTSVPSYRDNKVSILAAQIARRLNIPYLELFTKTKSPQQKNMENSYFQAKNIIDSVSLKDNTQVPKNLILIDDIVDSKWTLTVCGWLLKNAGASIVYPFCLADSSEYRGYN